MACEKHSDWIAEAALGELNPKRDAELNSHLSECAACSGEFDAAKAARVLMDRGVEALVAGTPSPQFAARFRSRIARSPAPSRSIVASLTPAAAGTLAIAALLSVWLLRTAPARNGRPASIASVASLPGVVAAPDAPPAVSLTARPRLQPSRFARSTEPEVLVPPGQLALVVELAEGVYADRVNGREFIALQQEIEKPLEIRPLETLTLQIQALDIPPMTSAAEDTLASAGDRGVL
jgi:anti-sigma factor RsiW